MHSVFLISFVSYLLHKVHKIGNIIFLPHYKQAEDRTGFWSPNLENHSSSSLSRVQGLNSVPKDKSSLSFKKKGEATTKAIEWSYVRVCLVRLWWTIFLTLGMNFLKIWSTRDLRETQNNQEEEKPRTSNSQYSWMCTKSYLCSSAGNYLKIANRIWNALIVCWTHVLQRRISKVGMQCSYLIPLNI